MQDEATPERAVVWVKPAASLTAGLRQFIDPAPMSHQIR